MSVSSNLYKINKYKTKLQSHPNNLIYKKKYNFYIKQIGGSLVAGSLLEALTRTMMLCKYNTGVNQQAIAAARTLGKQGSEAAVQEATTKFLNIFNRFKSKLTETMTEGIGKGDIPTNLSQISDADIKANFQTALYNLGNDNTCPVTGINLSNTPNDKIGEELAKQVSSLASYADKISFKMPTNKSPVLSEETLAKIITFNTNI